MFGFLSVIAGLMLVQTPVSEPDDWGDAPETDFAAALQTPQARAFDFWIGEWRSNWRLRDPDGLGFAAEGQQVHQQVFTMLGGKAVVELAWPLEATDAAGRASGISIRYLDGETGDWIMAQHWPRPGWDGVAFMDQLIGPEENGRIELYSHDPARSTPETTSTRRYTFTDIKPDHFRWEGANTGDGGDSWSTWTVIDLYRLGQDAVSTPRGGPWPGFQPGRICSEAPHGAFDVLEGRWTVSGADANGEPVNGHLDAGRLLDGCAIAGVLDISGRETFLAWSWSSMLQLWTQFSLSDAPGERHRYAIASSGGEGAVFFDAPGATIASPTENYYAGLRGAPAAALDRWVWQRLDAEGAVIVQERRASPEADWTTASTYTLSPPSR
ncbi:hypothetical protein [Maricaulis sp.]|uniref:hypothetical protein n=1 Tax=Maricaulis sp. TaxID=1486257 RepID=UPI003A940223